MKPTARRICLVTCSLLVFVLGAIYAIGNPDESHVVYLSPSHKKSEPQAIKEEGSADNAEHHSSASIVFHSSATSNKEGGTSGFSLEQSTQKLGNQFNCSRLAVTLNEGGEPKGRASVCCHSVKGDVDRGLTLAHLVSRFICLANKTTLRVMQIGANTGDNANDHLVKLLKTGIPTAVLLEPVPWIFKHLESTYSGFERVRLLNAAMSETVGMVSFMAPKESAKGWVPQMGGLKLPQKTLRNIHRKGLRNQFEKITVRSETFESLVNEIGWVSNETTGGKRAGVDVFVVDAEGYDAVILKMVLRSFPKIFGSKMKIPIIQYEWKHLSEVVTNELSELLVKMGYCVTRVHYDDIAYLPDLVGLPSMACTESFSIF